MAINQREIARVSRRVRFELQQVVANPSELSRKRQLDLWRHGFVAKQALLFDFDRYGFDSYLSEFERKRRLHRLNRNATVFADKLFSFLYLREIGAPTPTVYGFVDGEQLVMLNEHDRREGIGRLLEHHGRLVAKPRGGAHGRGVLLLERTPDRTLVNGREVEDLGEVLRGRTIVSEYVEQHNYASAIYPASTNTIRVLSLKRHEDDEPFVAAAMHRFGSERSKPVDNTGAGGFSAPIDLATGRIGALAAMPGAYLPTGRPVEWYDVHPDTGVRVTDTVIPRWSEIVDELNRTMSYLPGTSLIAWDVAVTGDGFSIIEGNLGPDTSFQVHGPVLLDERVRTLFQAHGVLSRLGRPSAGRRFQRA